MNKNINEWIRRIDNDIQRKRMIEIISYIEKNFKNLRLEIKWNQPMFILDKTFIIGFSCAKNHISMSPEKETICYFENELKEVGYDYSLCLIKIKNNEEINFDFIKKIIDFNIREKTGFDKFFR